MFDFKKLNDPVWQEEQRKKREREAQVAEAYDMKMRDAVEACVKDFENLNEFERSLVRSCRQRLGMRLPLSEKQETALMRTMQKIINRA